MWFWRKLLPVCAFVVTGSCDQWSTHVIQIISRVILDFTHARTAWLFLCHYYRISFFQHLLILINDALYTWYTILIYEYVFRHCHDNLLESHAIMNLLFKVHTIIYCKNINNILKMQRLVRYRLIITLGYCKSFIL